MPAVGGVASVLGIKCVNLFSCACVYCLGEGAVMCNWTRTPIVQRSDNYWHLLEVADLRFNLISFFNPLIFFEKKMKARPWEETCSVLFSTSLYCSASLRTPIGWGLPPGTTSDWLWTYLDQSHFSVKVNVWCKWTCYGWLPVGHAKTNMFCLDVSSIYWCCSLSFILASVCWLGKFDH